MTGPRGETRGAFVSGRPMQQWSCNTALPGNQTGSTQRRGAGAIGAGRTPDVLGANASSVRRETASACCQLEEKVKHIKGPVDKERAEIYLSGEFISLPARLPLPVSVSDGQHLHEPLELSALPRRLETLC